jgi:transposase InsO family protein
MASFPRIPLPPSWQPHARSGLLHAIALGHFGLVHIRSWCENSSIARVRLAGENERLKSEVAMLREELRIKDARLSRIPPRKRPQYPPEERLAIIALRAARAWTAEETARRFFVTGATIAAWMRRLDEEGADALVQTSVPVNRFPDFVRVLVRQLRAMLPAMGKVRIAQMLARAGLHLAPTTVRRLAREDVKPPPPVAPAPDVDEAAMLNEAPDPSSRGAARADADRVVTARYPHHVWHIDFTVVPTAAGLWIPWRPLSLLQRWPFAWWVGVVVDQFSRAVVAEAVFDKEPTAEELCALLDQAGRHAGAKPRYTVTDQGVQFQTEYRDWCENHCVKPRFGAIGQHGSIAIVERFIRSMKDEALRRSPVPLSLPAMRAEVLGYVSWYNAYRPHQALGGVTPNERLSGRVPACEGARIETRVCMPPAREDPEEPLRVKRCKGRLELVVTYADERKQLAVVELRDAA